MDSLSPMTNGGIIMKRLFALILTLSVLFSLAGCAAENANSNSGNAPTPDTEQLSPDTEQTAPGTQDDDTGIFALTDEELQQWTDYFNKLENNGLLRFPYSDPENDPDQLAPYLHLLFYDIGESESTFTDEERKLLEDAGLWLELDAFRLSREFLSGYLFDHFNIPAEKTENLLDAAKLGHYLLEYDAWYIAHGDTAYSPYTIVAGWVHADGTVRLSYFNDFLAVMLENGELDYADAAMTITLVPREDGTYYIVSHEIDSSTWSE